MKNRALWLAIIICLTLWTFSCSGPADKPKPTAVPVNVAEVVQEDAVYHDLYPGNVIAINEVELRSEVNGFITGIFFKEGQVVRKGQKLYEIEQNKYAADYNQANASLQIAKSNFQKFKNDADRYNQLGQQGLATKQKVEYSQSDLETAKMQVSSAEAQLAKSANDLKHSIITAPFDGTIGISLVKMGTYINTGSTLLNTISSDDPMAVDFSIDEKEISRFLKLKNSTPADSTFTLALPDKSTYTYPGVVELFDRAVDPQTGTLKVRLRFPNSQGFLKSGMSANVKVLNKNSKKIPVIPFKAVMEQMGEYFVYVIEKDTARQHKIKLGSAMGDKVIVLDGITPGEQIVIEGIQKLKDGTAVQIGAPKQETQPSKK